MNEVLVARLRAAGCVFAEDEAELLVDAAGGDAATLDRLAARRCAGEPLEQVVGWARFGEVRVAVRPGVFVPRMRSEALVAEALRRCPLRAPLVVDLCCGSAALGLAVAHDRPGCELHVADIDDAALACARENVDGVGQVHAGDLFAALPASLRARVDMLLANVPYVPTTQIPTLPAEAREHEPVVTLDGGHDGLVLLRRVAADAAAWLAPHGVVLHEVAAHQVDAACAALAAAGLTVDIARDDELEAHIVVGTRT